MPAHNGPSSTSGHRDQYVARRPWCLTAQSVYPPPDLYVGRGLRAYARIDHNADMARVRVGVKRHEFGIDVDEVGAPGVEVFQHWVEINGIRFETEDTALLDVSYNLGRSDVLRDGRGNIIVDDEGHAVREYPNDLQGEIVIRFVSHGFETVDYREPPEPLLPKALPSGD